MRVKPSLLAGFFVLTLMGTAAIPVAQAEDKKGFFGKVFNHSDSHSDAKPLFIEKGTKAPVGGNQVKPYNFKQQTMARTADTHDDWQERVNAEIMEQSERAAASGQARIARARQALREARAAEAGQRTASQEGVKKKMVYDPDMVWTYDPNKPKSGNTSGTSGAAKRIYNSTRD